MISVRFQGLKVYDLSPIERRNAFRRERVKDLVVLHETVTGDNPLHGADIEAVVRELVGKGGQWGIHGANNRDGLIGWAVGLGDTVFWQAGGVNERSIGIEQVSPIPMLPATVTRKRELWAERRVQLESTAQLVAVLHHVWRIPLVYSDGDHPGVTTHYSVSLHHPESDGHTDCWPVHLGGYYPALSVIARARQIVKSSPWLAT